MDRSTQNNAVEDWWHNHRESWSAAFICHDVDRHSLAESGNSIMARKGIVKSLRISTSESIAGSSDENRIRNENAVAYFFLFLRVSSFFLFVPVKGERTKTLDLSLGKLISILLSKKLRKKETAWKTHELW